MSEQVTLSIPTSLYRRARRIAALRQRPITDILAEAITLEEERAAEETAVDREEAAFHRLHPALRQQYAGQYVAVYGGKCVGHDPDQVALFLRMRERYPHEFVWIAPIQETPEEIYQMRSPRFADHN
ncbi:MAG: hypothetical protein GY805_22455 [Chloroflexi bacterium]|nr:hypothetical protein [Chloroflexota bacterium]